MPRGPPPRVRPAFSPRSHTAPASWPPRTTRSVPPSRSPLASSSHYAAEPHVGHSGWRMRYDVAIVGYGPVGQTLAILLGQRGRTVAVLEKQPAAYPLPRAVHFDHEVGRILQAAGVADGLVGMTEVGDVYEWRNAAGETLLRFSSQATSRSGRSEER